MGTRRYGDPSWLRDPEIAKIPCIFPGYQGIARAENSSLTTASRLMALDEARP
jgi:hypothetical protein